MASRRASIALVVSAFTGSAGWTACSSFAGDNVAEPGAEAGSDGTIADGAEGAAPTDAAVDAPRGDSSCESGPRSLCDDFEGPLGTQWTKTTTIPGDLKLSTEQHVSPSHALVVTIDPDAGLGGAGQALLRHEFLVPNTQGLTCDFEVFADTLSPVLATGSSSSLLAFDLFHDLDSEADGLTGYMIINGDATALYTYASIDGGTFPAQTGNPGPLPLGSWSHFRLDIDLASKEISVQRNGAPLLLVTAMTAFTKNNGIGLTFGVNAYALATKYFIDDVVCTLR